MAINIRKIDAVILEGEEYYAWGTKYDKFIRLNMDRGINWYILDDAHRIVTDMLPEHDKVEKLYKEANGFLEQMELF